MKDNMLRSTEYWEKSRAQYTGSGRWTERNALVSYYYPDKGIGNSAYRDWCESAEKDAVRHLADWIAGENFERKRLAKAFLETLADTAERLRDGTVARPCRAWKHTAFYHFGIEN